MKDAVFSSVNIPAAMAVLVIAISAAYADHQNKIVSDQAVRADVLAKVNLIRAKLEGNINGNLQLVHGLVATVVTEPYMGQQRFASLARNLFGENSQLNNIAGAPDLVVSLLYPLKGNEKAMGLDYRKDDWQRKAALRARDERKLILAGPVDLKQGGQGFIGRFPVFVSSAGDRERFWGIISAVVDVQRLYKASGLFDDDLGIDIALIGRDALGPGGVQFFGSESVRKRNPVTAEVLLPSGSWQIAATPKNGWPSTPSNAWLLRTIMAAAGALVVIPFLVAGRLLGERQRNYAELRRLSRRLELALEASAIGVWEHDLATNNLSWDDRVNEIYGKPSDGGHRGYSDWAGAIHPLDLARANADFDGAVASGGTYSSEYRIVRPDGEIRYVRSKATIYQALNETPKMIGAEWDVTADVLLNSELIRAKQLSETKNAELESAKARIEHIALHDSLTGLPNRRYLDQVLKEYAAKTTRGCGYVGLLHIDLDRFKHINDTLGHAAGDAMLVHASAVLRSTVEEGGFVARIGGDEFVVLCTVKDIKQLGLLADNIISQMSEPVYYHGHRCRFGASVGIAVDNDNDIEAKHLLVNADIALYQAKTRGRNRYDFFTEVMQSEIVDTKRTADEVLGGLERNEFIAFYQPQFDAKTLEIVGVEALARWRHPKQGILAPDAFLRIADELNVVSMIDRSILNQSLSDFAKWSNANLKIPRVSVNVSARRLQDEELITNLRELKIKKGTVSFELVESIFLDGSDDLIAWNVNQIKELGIDIEIDDFGTGYASIVSLIKLQPRRLKIDRQLIIPIVRSSQQRRIVSSIIEIGKSLGIEVIAEGVETMEHAWILKDLGCDILQGYAFGHALDSEGLQLFVQSRRLRAVS
ncbi:MULTISPECIES: EAL domain-containing protein [unclassified Mesorhizobium]|uniref:bifunctional diguanylate cyclase/phosphodiesterase n=1 Tax=unclassified Mesorhizobium TaxID=325217 RepID=UPI001CCEB9B1|nr:MULTISPECIES: EAL domain-containing protein [unclassified Mesorhizobium]MBZ9701701.1 EAL domain-containing protein [Mesorhizobium sp. CO1-1-3]MBZ9949049.1 EAL domain-containing protein [Mesorhizobium sp. BR1-1-11]